MIFEKFLGLFKNKKEGNNNKLTVKPFFGNIIKVCNFYNIYGHVAEWLGTGLQNPSPRFNSGRDLIYAQVVELVYTRDLKSLDSNILRVRVPPWAHKHKSDSTLSRFYYLKSFVFLLSKEASEKKTSFLFRASNDNKKVNTAY